MRRSRHGLAIALPLLACSPLAAQEPGDLRSGRLEMAAEARAEGDFQRAQQILLSLLAETPDDADLLRRLAMLEADAGRLDQAMLRIDEAAGLAPDDLDVTLAQGFVLFWRGDIAGASRAAAAISARDPDYPELDQLQAALNRRGAAGHPRLRSLSASVGISEITLANGADRTWNSESVDAAFNVSREDTLAVGVMREERSTIDTRIGARLDHRMQDGYFYLATSAVPAPDFLERWSLGAGGEMRIQSEITAQVDLRLANYDTETIVAFQPGLRIALDPDFAITGQAINIYGGDEGYRLGGSVRLEYGRERATSAFLIVASYPDAEADGLRQLRSLAAGARLPLAENLAARIVASFEDREDSYRRYAATMALTYRFSSK